MLPEPSHKFVPPLRGGVKALDMDVVKLIEFFFGIDLSGDKHEIDTVHFAPVLFKGPEFMNARPDRGPRKWGEFGHIHIVKVQRYGLIACFFD